MKTHAPLSGVFIGAQIENWKLWWFKEEMAEQEPDRRKD